MSHAKQSSKRKRVEHAPCRCWGAAGLSLSLASGASAATSVPAADMPTQNTPASHEIHFGEEEIADVSLATFYVFDKRKIVGTSRARRTTCQTRRRPRLPEEAAEAATEAAEAATEAAEAAEAAAAAGGGAAAAEVVELHWWWGFAAPQMGLAEAADFTWWQVRVRYLYRVRLAV